MSDAHQRRFDDLVAQGIADPADAVLWSLLSNERGARLLDVLARRTRYVTIVLEAVHDGHNQAAVLRSADAFGVQNVTIIEAGTRFAPHHRISHSADKWLSLRREPDASTAIGRLRADGYRVWSSRLDPDAVPIDLLDLSEPAALVFGNEHEGVSEEACRLADGTFVVPMFGFVQSMNVSVAAAITMFDVTRRARREAGGRYTLSLDERRAILAAWLRVHLPRGRPLPKSAGLA
jgi:tRNA (guanosine-2'-O-)-methyltransferase